MADRVFVDTNVLIRMLYDTLPSHQECYIAVERLRDADSELWISRQIIRECLVRMTHPTTFSEPLSIEQALMQIDTLYTLFKIADETDSVTQRLFELLRTTSTRGKQIHDANIVATMLVYGIGTLLTINVSDMKRFADKVKIISP
jgi:predicted nucleic acid-binding protein